MTKAAFPGASRGGLTSVPTTALLNPTRRNILAALRELKQILVESVPGGSVI